MLRLLPKSVLNYLKQLVHEDEFNKFLRLTRSYYAHDFISETLNYFQVKVVSKGIDNIPVKGGCIIACNHPLGGMDGIAVMNEVGRVRTDIKALVNDILMNLENLNSLLLPVNKHGKNATENLRLIDQAYGSSECIIVFPAGLVSRRMNYTIKDLEWKKSFISKAIKYKRPVIPVHIDARNSNFFYNLASFRRSVGIKINIEMFLLVDEVFRQKGKTINLRIGSPIGPDTFTTGKSHSHWAQYVKEKVYALRS